MSGARAHNRVAVMHGVNLDTLGSRDEFEAGFVVAPTSKITFGDKPQFKGTDLFSSITSTLHEGFGSHAERLSIAVCGLSIVDLMKASTLERSYQHAPEVDKPDRRVVASMNSRALLSIRNPQSEIRN